MHAMCVHPPFLHAPLYLAKFSLPTRVYRTGGNRFGPVPVGSQPVQIQNLNLNLKNEKVSKILKNTSRCVESNGVKNFQISVRLV
jgi:hypothetical protein